MSGERNWAENLTYSAERVVRPRTAGELRDIVRAGGPLRALGTRHCFNDIADTTGALVSLADMPREIDVTAAGVRVSGGVRYGDVAPVLEENGRALANLASLPHISVAGAVATGTHGSGDRVPSLSAAVRAVTILTPDGDDVTLTREDADFGGAVVHLGALGIVTSLELDTEPSYQVAQHAFDAPRWDAILADYDEVTSLGDSVSIFTTWRDPEAADQLWVKTRVTGGAAGVDESAIARLGARAADGPRHPIPGVGAEACNPQGGVPGPWFERLPHFRMDFTPSVGAELQSEFFVARGDAPAAIDAVRGIADVIAPLLHVCEIRSMAADDLWLSPSSGRDSVALHFTWRLDEPAVRAALPLLEGALAPFDARPHWGKVFTRPGDEVAAQYVRMDDFRALREKLDPEGRMQNDFTRRLGL
ncbi:FAD-binding protein [Microbacterium karelineae]|uniref:FAD-binding protein n=1 Tax=Microbacterium karelineae TaxID=2654283 RepID=UPI0018D4AC6E|nr:FAD-binding protein [Microbacterium karelineae]